MKEGFVIVFSDGMDLIIDDYCSFWPLFPTKESAKEFIKTTYCELSKKEKKEIKIVSVKIENL